MDEGVDMSNSTAEKPRIKLIGRANWQCADKHLARCGKSWKQAYDRWLTASLRDAMARAQKPKPVQPVKTAVTSPAVVQQPSYPASVVRKVPGVAQRPSYSMPGGLKRNLERAVSAQQPLMTISKGEGA